ncbi:O-antigen polymerase [Flavobacterium sp. GSP27]|uniref:O-antigen polymerase n=1 Tax=Flavobacterium sp. GSP27 TaxID=2497489 RepID=UPI000F81B242|nr:O-antigen polymerase [Flavobacterium sp. GSP27]
MKLLFYLYFISTLLFPTIFFNKLIFVIIISFTIVNYKLYRFNTISPFIILLIFLYGFLFSFFNNVDSVLREQFFFSVLVLFLIYPIIYYKIDIEKIAKVSGLIIAAYTALSFLIVIIFIDMPFSGPYYVFFENYSSGSNGLREFAEEGLISFHIGTVPFLYLPLILYVISFVEKKKFSSLIAILIIFTTIFVSGSRGSVLTSICATIMIIFFKSKFITKIVFFAISIPLLTILFTYLITNTSVFDTQEASNTVKIGHYESFFDHLNFFNFFLGEGLASYYYSKGVQAIKAHTELTPLDMLRYFGFILTPLLYFYIIFPTKKILCYSNKNSLYLLLVLIYVLNSITNPTMFNSYGLLIILWYWYKILDNSNVKDEEVPLI